MAMKEPGLDGRHRDKDVLLIPDKEAWSLQFDSRNWREITPADELEPHERSPGTLRLNMVLFNPIFRNVHGPAPSLDEFIDKEETVVEPVQKERLTYVALAAAFAFRAGCICQYKRVASSKFRS